MSDITAAGVTCPYCGHEFVTLYDKDAPSVICPDCGKEFAPEE